MVIDCYYTLCIPLILSNRSQYLQVLLNVNIKILLFDKILLDFENLNCWYGKTTYPIFMKFTQITKEGI